MGELEKTTGILVDGNVATHEAGWYFPCRRHLHWRLHEGALKELVAEIDNGRQTLAATDTAALLVENMHTDSAWVKADIS
jgi:hypothetical protein